MTGLELFAFVILPFTVAALSYGAVRWFEQRHP
jgi:hypothetical protein